jgi:hypothetical protein
MQIKTTLRFISPQLEWLSLRAKTAINTGKNVVKQESSYTIGENANYCKHYRRQYGDSSKS